MNIGNGNPWETLESHSNPLPGFCLFLGIKWRIELDKIIRDYPLEYGDNTTAMAIALLKGSARDKFQQTILSSMKPCGSVTSSGRHTLLNPNQLRFAGITVQDNPFDHDNRISTEHPDRLTHPTPHHWNHNLPWIVHAHPARTRHLYQYPSKGRNSYYNNIPVFLL